MSTLPSPFGPVDWTRDALGYPTVRARDRAGAAWGLGWFHAQDRLVQIQLMLAVARGRALELLGDGTLARGIDRGVLLHDLAGGLDAQVARIGPAMRARVDAYCAGFEAGVAARGWPLVLRAARIRRAPYRAQEMVLAYRMVSYFGLTSLVETPRLVCAELAARGVSADAIALLLGDAAGDHDPAFTGAGWPDALAMLGPSAAGGSNTLAVAAARSTTGGALLLGDPHLEIARIPPTFYAVHTELPDGPDVQGLTVPGLCWPTYGRNRHVAWAYTNGHGDAVDVRAARCRRGEVWDGAAWRRLAPRDVTVRVKKCPTEAWRFWDGPGGTIVGDAGGDAERVLPCVRWAGLADTWRDFDAGAAIGDARDVDEAVRANQRLATLSLHAIVADTAGRIAYTLTGHVARRAPESRPTTIDPAAGVWVSANERRDGPGGERWVSLPEPSYRHDRLTERTATGPLGPAQLVGLVRDAVDAGARRLAPIWAPHLPDDARARALVAWAADQPGSGDAHFAQLTLFTALHHEVTRAVLARFAGDDHARRVLDDLGGLVLFQHHVDEALALARPALVDAAALAAALAAAWPRALARAARPEHRLPLAPRFVNAVFAGKLPRVLGFDTAPVTLAGGPTTPQQFRRVDFGGQALVMGSAGRYLVDLGGPGGWYSLPGGASERRRGPGYARGIGAWARGELAPLGPAGAAPR